MDFRRCFFENSETLVLCVDWSGHWAGRGFGDRSFTNTWKPGEKISNELEKTNKQQYNISGCHEQSLDPLLCMRAWGKNKEPHATLERNTPLCLLRAQLAYNTCLAVIRLCTIEAYYSSCCCKTVMMYLSFSLTLRPSAKIGTATHFQYLSQRHFEIQSWSQNSPFT